MALTRSLLCSPARRGVALALVAAVIALVLAVPIDRTVQADYATDCASPTVTYDGNTAPANLNLTAADIVLFATGTYTGSVNSNLGTICVAAGAAYNPTSVNGTSRLFVRGSALMPPLAAGSGALLDNEGSVTFLPQPNTNGIATVINRAGATIIAPGLALGPGVTVTNDGTIEVQGGVNLNGSTVTNNGELSVDGPFNISGIFTNTDQTTVAGVLTVNGDGTLVNECSLTAGSLINNNAATNNGVVALGTGELRNNAGDSWDQGPDAISIGGDFVNSGSVTGSGQYLFGGNTLTEGSIVGSGPGAPIVFYDTTPTGGQIFDTQLGVITAVVREEVVAPPAGACQVDPPVPTTTDVTTTDVTTTDVTTTDVTTTDVTTTDVTTTDVTTTDVTTTDVTTTDVTTVATTDPPTGSSVGPLPPVPTPASTVASGGAGGGGAGTGGGSLPSTGSDGAGLLVPFAAAVVVAGVLAAAVARRPSTDD